MSAETQTLSGAAAFGTALVDRPGQSGAIDWAEQRRDRLGFLPPLFRPMLACDLTRQQEELLPTGRIIEFVTGPVLTQNFHILAAEADPFTPPPPSMIPLEVTAASLLVNFLKAFASTEGDDTQNMGGVELRSLTGLRRDEQGLVFLALHPPFAHQDYHRCPRYGDYYSLQASVNRPEIDCAHCRLDLLTSGRALEWAKSVLPEPRLRPALEGLNDDLIRSYSSFATYATNFFGLAVEEVRDNLARQVREGLQSLKPAHRHYMRHIHGDEPAFSAAQGSGGNTEERLAGAFERVVQRLSPPAPVTPAAPVATQADPRDAEIAELRAQLAKAEAEKAPPVPKNDKSKPPQGAK